MAIARALVLCVKLAGMNMEFFILLPKKNVSVTSKWEQDFAHTRKKTRGLKLSDGKTVGGGGRLTDKRIDKMQNFYGQCIRNNVGNKEGMVNDIWAIFKHMIIDETKTLEEQHSNCPKDENSWCKFWSNREMYNENNRLTSVFIDQLELCLKLLLKMSY